MANQRSVRSLLAAAGVAWVALAGLGSAQAHDVNWSVGISSPGVVVGASHGHGVRVLPPPVYVAPPPPPPRPVYYPAPVQPIYYAPPPVYVSPPPAYVVRDRDREHRRYHHRHHRHDRGHGNGYGYERHHPHWERR